jgi:hypothetical protein
MNTLGWVQIATLYTAVLQDIVRQVCVWETVEILAAMASRHWHLRPLTGAFESHREATSWRRPVLCCTYDGRGEWHQSDHIAVVPGKVDVVENASTD